MAFQTLAFLGFLALTVLLCHALGRVRPSLGRAALLLGCLYFCWQAGWQGMAVLAIGAAVSFLAGPRAIPGAKGGKAVFRAAAGYHILALLGFKYLGFFTGGAVSVPFVPLGLSFFTFQQLWYLKECRTGETAPVRSLPDYLLYSFSSPASPPGRSWSRTAFSPSSRGSASSVPTAGTAPPGSTPWGAASARRCCWRTPWG